jgi:hypothetical protein
LDLSSLALRTGLHFCLFFVALLFKFVSLFVLFFYLLYLCQHSCLCYISVPLSPSPM